MDTIKRTAKFLLDRLGRVPAAAIVLGSGLSGLAGDLSGAVEIPFEDIPNFPLPSVEGHKGSVLAGELMGRFVLLLRGRVHLYEGHPASRVVFPTRVFAAMGIRTLVLTNAAGGIDPGFSAGDIMLIEDHLNLMCVNPLGGPNLDDVGPRFPDMSEVYDGQLRRLAREAAAPLGIRLREGVFAAMPGPSYETPAEVRMLRVLGASAVGMSTVPEAIAARHAGMRVIAFSMIANLAAGISPNPLSHEEVLKTGEKAGLTLARLIGETVARMGND